MKNKKLIIGAYVHGYPPYHNAGAEYMLHAILSNLIQYDFECKVGVRGALAQKEPYSIDGVEVGNVDSLENVDIIISHLHLSNTASLFAKLKHKKFVLLSHNSFGYGKIKGCDLAVYNTEYLKDNAPVPNAKNSIVVHPPVWPELYKVNSTREYITLINLCREKGGEMLFKIAELLPDHKFLGVVGAYGEQIVRPVLNVDLMQNQKNIREVYKKTKILLMPSEYESYGRVAIEASMSGIPVIANKTFGLEESLSYSGIWSRMTPEFFAQRILEVEEDYDFYTQRALQRAQDINADKEIEKLALMLRKI